jgi:transcriptional regulator with XRE-family HTH domain
LITLVAELKNSKMNRIKEVLEQKGIKQIWLSEQLGKSYNMVNSYVQNRRQPSIEDLYKIAEILSVDVTELLKNKTNV